MDQNTRSGGRRNDQGLDVFYGTRFACLMDVRIEFIPGVFNKAIEEKELKFTEMGARVTKYFIIRQVPF